MSDIGQELEMLKRHAVTARRTRQRPPQSRKQKIKFNRVAWAMDKELGTIDPSEELVTDEFLETADDYEDELSAYELQNCMNSILSSVDVSVCSNAFVIPADSYEIVNERPTNHIVRNNQGTRFTPDQQAYLKKLKRREKEKDAETRHLEAVREYQIRRKAHNLKVAILKDYAFRRFPNKNRRRASGMKYAVVFNNQPIRETHSTVIYFKTLREAKAARLNLMGKFGFKPEDIEILKTIGKDDL